MSGIVRVEEHRPMTTITIFPEHSQADAPRYRALAGEVQSEGSTAGEALDALTSRLGASATTTLVIVQPMRPDAWFSAEQQRRLGELLPRWRAARDAGTPFPAEEQAELDALVEAELRAAGLRAAALARQLPP
jgi:hypothetical protein